MLKANDELYEEAQRLSDIEAKWQLEKEQLEGELAKLSRQLEDLDKTSSVSQVLAENHSHTVEQAWSQTQFLSSFFIVYISSPGYESHARQSSRVHLICFDLKMK